jgi:hypothetical protein
VGQWQSGCNVWLPCTLSLVGIGSSLVDFMLCYAKDVFGGGHVPAKIHWNPGVAEQSAATHCRQVSTFPAGHVPNGQCFNCETSV